MKIGDNDWIRPVTWHVSHVRSVSFMYDSLRRRLSDVKSKIEKVPRVIQGEKSSKDMASSRNLVSTIGAQASPKMGDITRCPEE